MNRAYNWSSEVKVAAANRLAEIYYDITNYGNRDYNYNVLITTDGNVLRGDLHIDNNSWTEFHIAECNIAWQGTLSPLYTEDDVRTAKIEQLIAIGRCSDVEDLRFYPVDYRAWEITATYAIETWANDLIDALSDGDNTDDIWPEMNW